MTDEKHEEMLRRAQTVVREYGNFLATANPTVYAIPVSSLPHPKQEIQDAIQLLLWEVGDADETVRNSLAEAYVFLAQFIPDADADVVSRGYGLLNSEKPEDADWELAERAAKLVNQIKLEMETRLDEIRVFMRKK